MLHRSSSGKRWNLFARELEDILRIRKLELNHLNSRVGIHTQTVSRLKESLITPRFHLLGPEELDEVIRIFEITHEEQLRLRAAILATAIEETLINRIDPDNALKAAEEIFPIILKALRQRVGKQGGLAATRGIPITEEASFDYTLKPALKALDRAIIALHLSRYVDSPEEQVEQTRQARDSFVIALRQLEELGESNGTIKASSEWQEWHTMAQNGLANAEKCLLLSGA